MSSLSTGFREMASHAGLTLTGYDVYYVNSWSESGSCLQADDRARWLDDPIVVPMPSAAIAQHRPVNRLWTLQARGRGRRGWMAVSSSPVSRHRRGDRWR